MGYSRDFIKGLGWIGAFRMGAKAVVFLKIIVAYRYLTPREVGLFGLAAIALGLLEMMTETGVNIILIRDTKPLSYYLDTAFIVSIVRGALISLVLFLAAFVLPTFFKDQALFSLLLLVSVIPLIKGFINPAESKFIKDLHFEREAAFRIGLSLVDAMSAVIFVYFWQSAEALVWGMILTATAEVVYSQLYISPRPKFAFDKTVYQAIVAPGKWVNAVGIITFAEQNFDNIIVGRILGATSLGYYQTAFNLTRSLIAEVGAAVSQVLLPIYGRIISDSGRMRKAVLKLLLPVAVLMLFPVVFLNLHSVQEILIFFLKDKWRPALPLFLPLSICAWFTGMDTLINPLFLARNWIKSLVGIYAVGLFSMCVLMYWFTATFGLSGAALAVMTSRILIQPLFLWKGYRAIRAEKVTSL